MRKKAGKAARANMLCVVSGARLVVRGAKKGVRGQPNRKAVLCSEGLCECRRKMRRTRSFFHEKG